MKSLASDDPPDGPRPPAVDWASGPLGEVQRSRREIGRLTAVEARAVAAFAAERPASVDRPAGEPGCMSAERRAARPEVLADVSEWAAQELAMALSVSQAASEGLLARSLTLVHRLPRTLAALEAGLLHPGHLWCLLEKVAPIADAGVRGRLEADLLAWVAARSVTTPAQLGAKVRREVLARDVRAAARELEAALARRGVRLRPDRTDGMAVLEVLLTVPEGRVLLEALGRYADALDDEPGSPRRTRAQKMADCLMDLVLRPGETQLPPVQAQLTVVAPVATMLGGDQPAEVADAPVPAELARSLAQGFGLLPAPDKDPSDAGCTREPIDDIGATDDAALAAADEAWWAQVEARALAGEWGGEDGPSPEEADRLAAETAERLLDDLEFAALLGDPDEPIPLTPPTPVPVSTAPDAPPTNTRDTATTGGADAATSRDPGEESVVVAEPSWWAAADAAVEEAGAVQLALHRAVTRARRAVQAAELADVADRDAHDQSPAARITAAADALTALGHATAEQRAVLGGLLQRTGGGGLADRPRIAVTDALTGALLALTDARELCEAATCGRAECRTGRVVCDHDLTGRPGLGPPGASDTYRPGARLDRYMRARDRRCRFPGCRRRVPHGGELDHNEHWPDGPTASGNLTGFCTSHHRGKHQAPGWQYDLAPDGTLTVTTPTGLTAITTPPPF